MQVPWWYHRKCFLNAISDHPTLKLDNLSVELFEGFKAIGLRCFGMIARDTCCRGG
jgi:hypothetical protein